MEERQGCLGRYGNKYRVEEMANSSQNAKESKNFKPSAFFFFPYTFSHHGLFSYSYIYLKKTKSHSPNLAFNPVLQTTGQTQGPVS